MTAEEETVDTPDEAVATRDPLLLTAPGARNTLFRRAMAANGRLNRHNRERAALATAALEDEGATEEAPAESAPETQTEGAP